MITAKKLFISVVGIAMLYSNQTFGENIGDINCSEAVDLGDIILSIQISTGIKTSSSICKEADVNNDGKISLEEAIYGLQVVAGIRVPFKIHGLNFSPYIDGQDPNLGSEISEEQLRERMKIIAPYTNWIRSFGSSNGLEISGRIAHELGLKAALGAWISADLDENELQISNLINAAKAGEADMLIVGSEVLLRKELSESTLVDYINRVKQEVPDIPVGYADVYAEILSHRSIINAVDVVLVNYYPYWEGIGIDLAVSAIHTWHQQVTSAANGKTVVVSETGHPSAGNIKGDAIPNLDNASLYFLNFVSWARANNVPYFYFEAFDETWKGTYEEPQGAYWGLWDKNGNLKQDMMTVFNGEIMGDNWSSSLVGGPGTPSLEFTHIPLYGSFENLQGQVLHINPDDYKIAVYIYVSTWWIKPYDDERRSIAIQRNGSWICDITTGGIDQNATKIAAFLLPKSYNIPVVHGGLSLPPELDENAVAKFEATRSP